VRTYQMFTPYPWKRLIRLHDNKVQLLYHPEIWKVCQSLHDNEISAIYLTLFRISNTVEIFLINVRENRMDNPETQEINVRENRRDNQEWNSETAETLEKTETLGARHGTKTSKTTTKTQNSKPKSISNTDPTNKKTVSMSNEQNITTLLATLILSKHEICIVIIHGR